MPNGPKSTEVPLDADRELTISPEKACFIIKAREFDAGVARARRQ